MNAFLKSIAAVFLAALAVATSTATAAGPGISAGTGCAVQCITKALVTATATTAKVEIETTVLAHLTVTIAKPGGTGPAQVQTVHISAFSQHRTASFFGLEPDTGYGILVKATDLHGAWATRQGTFKTLPVKTTGLGGPSTIDSGLGCSAQCITKALFTQTAPVAAIANADLATSTDAKIQIVVSRDKPVATAAGPGQFDVVSNQSSPGLVRSWKTQVGGLLPGTRYYVVVRARDTQGRMAIRQGSFRTVPATALVTIHKIKIVADGDKGRNTGELYFRYFFGGQERASSGRFLKLKSGQVIGAPLFGTSRPGVTFELPANGDAKLDVRVSAEECDIPQKKHCFVEDTPEGTPGQYTYVGGVFGLSDVLSGALPGWYGTGVTPPSGHDGYFVFGPGDRYVKILVFATVDVRYHWPS